VAEVNLATLATNFTGFFRYLGRLLVLDGGPASGQLVWRDPVEWFWNLRHWVLLIMDTVLAAYVATLVGTVGAFVLCFYAARNMAPRGALRVLVTRTFELCRTVPEIVFALLFVIAFGLGPIAGVLAIAIHTMGANGKLFTEVVENVDMKPVEGVTATGARWVEALRFAVLPQVLSNFVSYTLLRFEINVRGASVMGFVGAGGIGQDLIEAIRKFYYTDISAMLVLLICTVTLIDVGSGRLRHALLGRERR
jgi:phosphonate transport system permease protein